MTDTPALELPSIAPPEVGTPPSGGTSTESKPNPTVAALTAAIDGDLGHPPEEANAEAALETVAEHDSHKKHLIDLITTPSDKFSELLDPDPANDERRQGIAKAAKFYSEKDDKGNLKHTQLLEADVDEHIRAEDEFKNITENQDEYIQRKKAEYTKNLQDNTEQLVKNKLLEDPQNPTLEDVMKELAVLRAHVAAGAYHQSPLEHIAHLLHGLDTAIQAPARAMAEGEGGTTAQGRRPH